TRLALDEEYRAIKAKIRGSEHRDRVGLVSDWAVRLDDLSGILMHERPDVVHFSGHGGASGERDLSGSSRDLVVEGQERNAGELILVGDDETPRPVPREALAGLFRVLKDNVRIVVLNACYSEEQARAIVQSIDCAVGMSAAIPDKAAIAFATEFYQALGFGKSVQEAFDLGVYRLTAEGTAAGMARLHTREGVKASEIVLVGAHSSRP
ncbi:MAG TPA: CHAT domain-containing protein, partial [Isosphaeraceae bacterium]